MESFDYHIIKAGPSRRETGILLLGLSELLVFGILSWAIFYTVSVIVSHYTKTPKKASQPAPDFSSAPVLGATSNSRLSAFWAGLKWIGNGVGMIGDAYAKNPHTIFRAPTIDEFYVLPPKYADELKTLPETTLHANHGLVDYFQGSLTTVDLHIFGRPLWNSVRGMTSQIPKLVDILAEQCTLILDRELRVGTEWTVVTPQPHMQQTVASMSAQAFVGDPMASSQAWIDTTINYAQNVFIAATLLKLFPTFMRPAVAKLLPQTRRLHYYRRRARELLVPEILRRRALNAQEVESSAPQRPNTMQILEQVSPEGENNPPHIADRELGLALAAIHGPTNVTVNVIYDIAAMWDTYGLDLRAEVERSLAESNGVWNKPMLNRLSKLDSFMKESARLQPGSTLAFFRKVEAPVRLSTGEDLPLMASIAVPAAPVKQSLSDGDAEAVVAELSSSSLETFDGYRFHRIRQRLSDSNDKSDRIALKNTFFTNPNTSYLIFGLGRFACPGRFFAECTVKIVIAKLLLRYDFGLPEGKSRPKNVYLNDVNLADPTAKITLRIRKS